MFSFVEVVKGILKKACSACSVHFERASRILHVARASRILRAARAVCIVHADVTSSL